MDQTLKSKLDEVEESLLGTFELALAYGDDDAKDTMEFLKMFEVALKARNEANNHVQALQKAKERSTIEEFEVVYKSELRRIEEKSYNAKTTKEYKAFQSRLKQAKESFDNHGSVETGGAAPTETIDCDDIVVGAQHIQTIDPLTKRQMENPVKNTVCGHSYDKAAILEAIRMNRRLRCPVAGCGNREHIRESQLVDNNALKLHILNMQTIDSDDEDDPLGI